MALQQFEVMAADANGKSIKLLVESDSARNARAKVRSQGLTPLTVAITDANAISKAGAGAASASISSPFGGLSTTDVANMTRQLATLIKAHVPVVESLSALVEQIEQPKLKKILSSIRSLVNEGKSLADGFAQFPQAFDRVYVNMVRAGESAGRLDVVLLRLADLKENQMKLKAKVRGALAYPVLMMVVAAIVISIIIIKVVPTITAMFSDLNATIPTPTRIVMQVSDFGQTYVWHVLIGILCVALLLERYFSTTAGRAQLHKWQLKLPLVGDLFLKLAVARFSRTLGTLLSSGVPMLPSLQITRNVVDNAVFEDIIETSGQLVSEGRSLAYTLKTSGAFPPIVVHMVGVGEKTGELEQMLGNVAENYEQQVDEKLGTLTTLLEPLMMVVMAGVVGFIVMAVILPILEMNQAVS